MQKISKNKMMDGEGVKNKELEEYFFSGGLEYEPQTIQAESQEEAEKIWEGSRKKVKTLSENINR